MDMYIIVTLIFGLILGGVSGFYLARTNNSVVKRAKELDIELQQTRDELDVFKDQVTQHFSKTAELVDTLTANYRAVYGHLIEGAQRFSNNDAAKIETTNTVDPLLSSGSRNSTSGTADPYNNTLPQEQNEESWYGDQPQDPGVNETAKDDRFH